MTENKRFNLWDIEGTAFIEDHKEGSYHIGKTEDVDIDSLRDITKRLNIYAEENEQLKRQIGNLEHTKDFCADVCVDCERLEKENEELKFKNKQFKKQLKIYEKFLEYNDLDFDWTEFCTADECINEYKDCIDDEIDCKDCVYLEDIND